MRNRKLLSIAFGAVAAVGVILIIIVFFAHSQKNRFAKYTDYNYGFEIEYPADWKFSKGYAGTAVMFFSESETAMDTFKENVSVVVQNLSNKPSTLDEYSRQAISQMHSIFKDTMVVLESHSETVAGLPGHKFVIIGKNVDKDIQIMFVWTLDGVNAYQLTFTALTSTFERYAPQFNRMEKSFKLLR